MMHAKATKQYDQSLQREVLWRKFHTGDDMARALNSGDVHVAVSIGLKPFFDAVNAGADHLIVDIAVLYSSANSCIVRTGRTITPDNALGELGGSTIGVAFGTMAHYEARKTAEYLGLEIDRLVDYEPEGLVKEFANPSTHVAMACAWGDTLNALKRHGKPVLDDDVKKTVVGKMADVIAVTRTFYNTHRKLLTEFIRVTNELTDAYLRDSAYMVPTIAAESEMTPDSAVAILQDMQLSLTQTQKQAYTDEENGPFKDIAERANVTNAQTYVKLDSYTTH